MSRLRTRSTQAPRDKRRLKPRVHHKYVFNYRGGTIEAAVVTPPKGVPDFDTIRFLFTSPRFKPYGIYLAPDEALAAASVLIDAVWNEGRRKTRWPER